MMDFFINSELLDYEVLRPLSHIKPYWETTWNPKTQEYEKEEGSYAGLLNQLIEEIRNTIPPARYHDNEDRLAQYVVQHLKWPLCKKGMRWVSLKGPPMGIDDYGVILQQGGFHDINEKELISAAAGRIKAAVDRSQNHFDEMEESHRRILAAVLSTILYHRTPSNE